MGIVKRLVECKPEELEALIQKYLSEGWTLYEKFDTPVYISGRGYVVGFAVINI